MAEVVETLDRHSDTLDKIQCQFCGSQEFTEIRFEGLYCKNCNAEIKMRLPGGDSGSIVEFLPNDPERDKKYTQKFLENGDEPYWTSKMVRTEDGQWIYPRDLENGGENQ